MEKQILIDVESKSPVFNNLQVLTPLVIGGKLVDIPAVMGSIDLCVGDLIDKININFLPIHQIFALFLVL